MKAKGVALVLLVLLLALALAGGLLAQSSAGFDLSWHVLGGGGTRSTSASYAVSGTAGQAVAGPPLASSANYAVAGGFWALPSAGAELFLPMFVR